MSPDAASVTRRVREIENLWIPLADGTRLAARVWLPEDAKIAPVPVILEYLPYRKRDGTSGRDALTHPYFAAHGYAAVRVDMRGCGDSDGLLFDEYTQTEHDDAVEIIAWLARQPWCSGSVGMIGISWGGFNGLQVAALRPPALKAIVTLCSTDDRYADDIHFMGGALLRDNLTWGATMFSHQTRPPDPAIVGDRWRAMWMERLENLPFFPADWLEHQRRDALWRHGSVCENWSAIQCAVYAVGGWADAYRNAIPRLLKNLKAPRKGLIGPWAHLYPHFGVPGPAIGFLQECVRWWDHWLKGIDTGIMAEPMLRAWMQESVRPAPRYDERPGRWVAENAWPGPTITPRQMFLSESGISETAAPATPMHFASPESTGVCSGTWCSHGIQPDDPSDQRDDDARSLCFDTPPLTERIEILGAPVLDLEIASDQPHANLIARLCEVQPDGASTRVTWGVLNLTHRGSHTDPSALVPGKPYRVRLQLNDIAYAFRPGHRIRVALSTNYFPLIWPAPHHATLTLTAGTAALTLPVRPRNPADAALPPFPPPEVPPREPRTALRPAVHERTVTRDHIAGQTLFHTFDDDGRVRIDPIDLEIASSKRQDFSVRDGDPLSIRMDAHWTKEMGRGDIQVRTTTRIVMTTDAENFRLHAECDAYEGEKRVFTRNWDRTIRRDFT
jgi:putative CocE/NonD family hydrolase